MKWNCYFFWCDYIWKLKPLNKDPYKLCWNNMASIPSILSSHLLCVSDFGSVRFALDQCCAAAKSLQSCPTLCDPIDGSPPGFPSLGFSRQEHWSGLPFPSPMHESEKWKWSRWVVSYASRPHGLQPTRLVFQARVLEWVAIAFSDSNSIKSRKKGKEFVCWKHRIIF